MTINGNTNSAPKLIGYNPNGIKTLGTRLQDVVDYSKLLNTDLDYQAPTYGLTDFAKDSAASFYQLVQKTEMNEEQLAMVTAQLNLLALDELNQVKKEYDALHGYSDTQLSDVADRRGEDGQTLREKTDSKYKTALQTLKNRGIITSDGDFVDENTIAQLIESNKEKYAKAEQNYRHNLDQYNSSVSKHDVSLWFTKKANETVTNWGNMFYKLAATAGSSASTPIYTLRSILGNMVGAKAGAAVGSKFGLAGTAIGAVAGATTGFLAGSYGARDYESRVEQLSALSEAVQKKAAQQGVDLSNQYASFRKQLLAKGIDTTNMDDQMVLEAAISTEGITSTDRNFERITKDLFDGSRKVYDKNMALGASDYLTELAYATPLGKFSRMFTEPASKFASNGIYRMLGKRVNLGADISRLGTVARNRTLVNLATDVLKRAVLRSLEEGTEEGAQQLIQYEYQRGQYDNLPSNENWWQSVQSGEVFKDIAGNFGRRAESLKSFLHITDTYRDDQLMFESMLMGALLPFTDVRSVARYGFDIVNSYKQIANSKVLAEALASRLENRDNIQRATDLLDSLDKRSLGVNVLNDIPVVNLFTTDSAMLNYHEIMQTLRGIMKSRGEDGKIQFGGLDTTALTDDGHVPSEAEIDEYFDTQELEFANLIASKKVLKNKLINSGIPSEDINKYVALRYNAAIQLEDARKQERQFAAQSVTAKNALLQNTDKNSVLSKLLSQAKAIGVDLNNTSPEVRGEILSTTEMWQNLRRQENALMTKLAMTRPLVEKNVVTQDALDKLTTQLNDLQKQKKELLENVKKSADTEAYGNLGSANIQKLIEELPELDQEFADNEQYRNLQKVNEQLLEAQTRQIQAMLEVTAFDNATPYAKSKLEEYKKSSSKDEALAELANIDAQTGETTLIDHTKEIAGDTKTDEKGSKITDLTNEQIQERKKEASAKLDANLQQINSIFDSVPQDGNNPVYKYIIEPINQLREKFADSPIAQARNISQNMRKAQLLYKKQLEDEKLPAETKEMIKMLYETAKVIGEKEHEIARLANEERQRDKKHDITLKGDSQTYVDEDGNQYVIDIDNTQFSENDGLFLNVVLILPEDKNTKAEKQNRLEQVKQLVEAKKNELQKLTDKKTATKEEVLEADKLYQEAKKQLELAKQFNESLNTNRMVMTSDMVRNMNLTRKDNRGVLYKLNDKLDKWQKDVDKKVADLKQHRNEAAEMADAEGDVVDYRMADDRDKSYFAGMRENDEQQRMPKAFTINTTYGKRCLGILNNSYYQAQFYHGNVTMPYQNVDDYKDYVKDHKRVDPHGRRSDAIELFHKIGKEMFILKQGNKMSERTDFLNQLVDLYSNDKTTSVKIGSTTITKSQWLNMVNALPLIVKLYQARLGKSHITTYCVDAESTGQNYSDKMTDERIEVIANLLLSYKIKANKSTANDVIENDGLTEKEAEEVGTNSLTIPQGSVMLFNHGFNYNIVSERDTEDDIFKTASGDVLDSKQLNELHKQKADALLLGVIDNKTALSELLQNLMFDKSAVDHLFETPEKPDEESNLHKLITGVLKYADGVQGVTSFNNNYLSKLIGAVNNKLRGNTAVDRQALVAKELMDFIADVDPTAYLSLNSNQLTQENTPKIQLQVERGVRNGYINNHNKVGNGGSEIFIQFNGSELSTLSKEDVALLERFFIQAEQILNDSKTAKEFITRLKMSDFLLVARKDSDVQPYQILRDYFNNRKYGRLAVPSTVFNAVTLASATPMNGKINYEDMHRRSRHENSKISDVKALHLDKTKNGRYLFSIPKWGTETKEDRKKDVVNETVETQQKQSNDFYNSLIDELDKAKTADEFAEFVYKISVPNAFGISLIDSETAEDFITVDKEGKAHLKSTRELTPAKRNLKEILADTRDNIAKEIETSFETKEPQEIADEDDYMKSHLTTPVTFAFGSFRDVDGKSEIVYFDAAGNRHTRRTVNGLPGAMYLIIPAYLNPQGKSVPLHLNTRKFTSDEAHIIAQLLIDAAGNLDSFIKDGKIKTQYGTLEASGTYREVIDQLIYVGDAAIQGDPSMETYSRLLQIRDDGVVYGDDENVATADLIDDLAEWIQENKTFRVDRKKAADANAISGYNIKITDSENKVLFERKERDNYITNVIDNGVLQTDVNHQRLFTDTTIRFTPKMTWSLNGTVSSESKTTPRTKKKALEAASEDEVREALFGDDEELTGKGLKKLISSNTLFIEETKSQINAIAKYLVKKLENIPDEDKDEILLHGTRNGTIYSDHVVKLNYLPESIDEQTQKVLPAAFSYNQDAFEQFFKRFKAGVDQKVESVKFVVTDSQGDPIKVDGQNVYWTLYAGNYTFEVDNSSDKSEQSKSGKKQDSEVNSSVQDLINKFNEKIAFLEGQLAALSGGARTGVNSSQNNDTATGSNTQKKPTAPKNNLLSKTKPEETQPTVPVTLSDDVKETILDSLNDLSVYSSAEQMYADLVEAYQQDPTELADVFSNDEAQIKAFLKQELDKSKKPSQTAAPKYKYDGVAEYDHLDAYGKDVFRKLIADNQNGAITDYNVESLKLYVMFGKGSFNGKTADFGQFVTIAKAVDAFIKVSKDAPTAVNVGAAFDYFSNFVEKEDFNSALNTVEQILGKGFPLQLMESTPKVWDANRQALIYVFGQCSAAGIRLFRDSDNKIAKGSLYHEAFHRISLFVLDPEERTKLYADARRKYKELHDKTDKQVEEYLADRFAEFVTENKNNSTGKYKGSTGVIGRIFKKIVDIIRSLINRLTSANITPKYKNLDKLFQDMYAGRFAYAKATKGNVELQSVAYEENLPYTGFIVNGIEIARDAENFNNIRRHLQAVFVSNANMFQNEKGLNNTSIDSVRDTIFNDIKRYNSYLQQMTNNTYLWDRRFMNDPQAKMQHAMTVASAINTFSNIVENWETWRKILKESLRLEFGLHFDKKRLVANTEDSQQDISDENDESGTATDNGQQVSVQEFSEFRDSYEVNLWLYLDFDVKLMLSDITIDSAKVTTDGLFVYPGVKKLFFDVIQAVSDSATVDEFLIKLKTAAQQANETGDSSLLTLYNKLTDSKTKPSVLNKCFTAFVKYHHNFVTNRYESQHSKEGTVPYIADIRSATEETIDTQIKNQYISSVRVKLSLLSSTLSTVKGLALFKQDVSTLTKLFDKPSLSEQESKTVAELFGKTLGFTITQDIARDATIWQNFAKTKDNRDAVKLALNEFQTATTSNFKSVAKSLATETSNSADVFVDSRLLGKTDRNRGGSITRTITFLQKLSRFVPKLTNTASQRGAEGARVYTEGLYTFITKVINVLLSDRKLYGNDERSSLLDTMSKNPYAQHSLYLQELLSRDNKGSVKFLSKLATVLDDDFDNSRADKSITGPENLLNLFSATMQGLHNIPSLANKKLSGYISGVAMLPTVCDQNGNLSQNVIDVFTGYLADEIQAIAEAQRVRNNFITLLNKQLHTSYTLESFSKLTATQQEEIFREHPESTQLLRQLVINYHVGYGSKELKINSNGRPVVRTFHLDFSKAPGVKFRYYQKLGDKIFAKHNLDKLAKSVKNADTAMNIAQQFSDDLRSILNENIAITRNSLLEEGLIDQNASGMLFNVYLPENLIKKYFKTTTSPTSTLLHIAIAQFALQSMSDVIEFEKLVSGDKGFHKDITSVNKRYSGLASTGDMTSDRSTIKNQWGSEDRLYNSNTFNAMQLNTSTVVNTAVYNGDMMRALGVDVIDHSYGVDGIYADGRSFAAKLDYKKLLDLDGKIRKECRTAPVVAKMLHLKEIGASQFLLSEQELAQKAVLEADNDFKKYLQTDPTDAQVYITAEMFRQLKQRNGAWTDRDEAIYNLYEHFKELPRLYSNEKTKPLVVDALNTLGVEEKDFADTMLMYLQQINKYPAGSQQKKYWQDRWKGYIYQITPGFDMTSLKYIYYGNDCGRNDNLVVPIYDKMSLHPIFEITADGHQIAKILRVMKQKKADYLKLESATKIGQMPAFEAFDENGNVDEKLLMNAPMQQQYFMLLNKQLNTNPHTDTDSTLLTQFMKIAMLDVDKNYNYTVNGLKVKGEELLKTYKYVVDLLTQRGAKLFKLKFGIDTTGQIVDKTKFMSALRDIMEQQNVPSETLAALTTEDGKFKIEPSALPNIQMIQSRIISQMGKMIVDTAIKGVPMYQVASFGYDNLFRLKSQADDSLLMPGEVDKNGKKVTRMQVRISSLSLGDVLEKLKAKGITNFEDQRQILLQSKGMISLSYRVPTQGQDSILPIEIVDILPPQQGAIIQFPSGITTQTGADFDIDKMYLARYNYDLYTTESTQNLDAWKFVKKAYDPAKLANHQVNTDLSTELLQNALLDMYQGVLTSDKHFTNVNTPLDVFTEPVKDVINKNSIKNRADKRENTDLFYTTPVFLTMQKVKNAGSDEGIAPMALNSVFRFWIQASGLGMRITKALSDLGLDSIDKIYDQDGLMITDSTSAQISAFVDAVKDNYIGAGNVRQYTYDVVSLLTSLGFGNSLYMFLMLPAIVKAADNYTKYRLGKIGVDADLAKNYLAQVRMELETEEPPVRLTPQDMTFDNLKKQLENPTKPVLNAYLNLFLELKEVAQFYRQALTIAQVDTKKYGNTAGAMISFIQRVNDFMSDKNYVFSNANVLYDNTFLGQKYELGVKGIFDALGQIIFEFSTPYKNTIDDLTKAYGKYGRSDEAFQKAVYPKIKTIIFNLFFNQYLFNRFPDSNKPLQKLTCGETSVPARFLDVKQRCLRLGIGSAFFQNVYCNYDPGHGFPQFMIVNNTVKDDMVMKSNIQVSLADMFESNDPVVQQWAKDLVAYMYYISGGSDANAGGKTKTTVYDLIPPQYIGSMTIDYEGQTLTFNDFVSQFVLGGDFTNALSKQQLFDNVMRLANLTDTSSWPVIRVSDRQLLQPRDKKTSPNSRLYVGAFSKTPLGISGISVGAYLPYIKVNDGKNTLPYKCTGIQVVASKKTSKLYMNPLYTRVQQLGYANMINRSFSIRSDGYLDGDGMAKSMLWSDEEFKQDIEDYDTPQAVKIAYTTNGLLDFRDIVDDDGTFTPVGANAYLYTAVDFGGEVLYIADKTDKIENTLLQWATMKDKEVNKVTDPDAHKIDNRAVTLVGNIDCEEAQKLIRNNPNVMFYIPYDDSSDGLMPRPEVLGYSNVITINKYSKSYTNLHSGSTQTNNVSENASELEKQLVESGAVVHINNYTRRAAEDNQDALFIFTDNGDHTSSVNGPVYGSENNPTTAVVRGLPNAAGITTMKYFYKLHGMKYVTSAQFTDADIELVKKTVYEELDNIKQQIQSGKYNKVVLPGNADGLVNAGISQITKERTPLLFDVYTDVYKQLLETIEAAEKGKKIGKHCK